LDNGFLSQRHERYRLEARLLVVEDEPTILEMLSGRCLRGLRRRDGSQRSRGADRGGARLATRTCTKGVLFASCRALCRSGSRFQVAEHPEDTTVAGLCPC
jgi:hypothetical protein